MTSLVNDAYWPKNTLNLVEVNTYSYLCALCIFLESMVSKAIVRKGGNSIERECRELGRVEKSGVAVTNAGNLNVLKIIHVATPTELDKKLG